MTTTTAQEQFIGKYAIVRSRDQGVMCGVVQEIDGRAVTLTRARQMWRWDSTFVLQDMANTGPRSASNCMFSEASLEPTLMLEACGVLLCTGAAQAALEAVPAQKK